MDPFARAVDALFNAPGSLAVDYFVESGAYLPVRIILSQPDQQVTAGRTRFVEGSYAVSVRRSEVTKPISGDVIRLLDRTVGRADDQVTGLKVYGEPRLDAEGLTWSFMASPVE